MPASYVRAGRARHSGVRSDLLRLTLILAAAGCADTAPVAPLIAEPPVEKPPQLTFGSPATDQALGVAIQGSGVFVVGYTEGALDGPYLGNGDSFARKYDTLGDLLWADQFGTPATEVVSGVATDFDGNAYVTGYTQGSLAGNRGGDDGILRRYNSNGTISWTRQFGSTLEDHARAVAVDRNASMVYAVGHTRGSMAGSNQGNADVMLVRYDASGGAPSWVRQFGTTAEDIAFAVAVDSVGAVYVGGMTTGALSGSNSGSEDAFLRKYDAAGNVIWTKQFGTTAADGIRGIALDSAHVIVVGYTNARLQGTHAGSTDGFVRKYSGAGSMIMTKQFGTASIDEAVNVAVDASHNFYIAGHTGGTLGAGSAGGIDAFVRKYNSANGHEWTSQFGTVAEDGGVGIAVLPSGAGVFVAGRTAGALVYSNAGSHDAFIRRIDGNGKAVWTDQ